MYGVFDGHGENGHCVANFVRQSFKGRLKKRRSAEDDLAGTLSDCFRRVHAELRISPHLGSRCSGTTATVVVHERRRNRLTVSHVGDSMAVIVKQKPDSDCGTGVVALPLTRDHDPSLPDEQKRIEAAGGVVVEEYGYSRVYRQKGRGPGLNLSRSLGDTLAHSRCGVTAEPEVSTHQLCSDDRSLLVCSDGVWTVVPPQEAADIIADFGPDQAVAAARVLADAAMNRWLAATDGTKADDISVILACLHGEGGVSLLDSDSDSDPSASSSD